MMYTLNPTAFLCIHNYIHPFWNCNVKQINMVTYIFFVLLCVLYIGEYIGSIWWNSIKYRILVNLKYIS